MYKYSGLYSNSKLAEFVLNHLVEDRRSYNALNKPLKQCAILMMKPLQLAEEAWLRQQEVSVECFLFR